MGNLQDGQDKPVEHRADDDGQDHRVGLGGIDENSGNIPQRESLINKEGDEQAVHRADRRRLRRREDADIDAADDQNRQEQAPGRMLQHVEPFLPGRRWLGRHAVGTKYDDIQDEESGQDQSGNDSGNEQAADGFAGDGPEQDHRNAGRDQDAERAAAGDQAQNQFLRITARDHFRDSHHADGDGGRDAGAGNGGKGGAGHDGGDAEAGRQMAQPFAGDIVQVVADLAGQQDLAEQDIKGNGREHEVIQRLVADDRDLGERTGPHGGVEGAHAGDAQTEGDRQSDQQ